MLHKIFCMMDRSRDLPAEVRCAIAAGTPVGGICLYPIVATVAIVKPARVINDYRKDYQPLTRELQYQQLAFDRSFFEEAGAPAEVDATRERQSPDWRVKRRQLALGYFLTISRGVLRRHAQGLIFAGVPGVETPAPPPPETFRPRYLPAAKFRTKSPHRCWRALPAPNKRLRG